MTAAELEAQLSKLSDSEKKQLLRRLIADLDEGRNESVKRVWLEEAQRRYTELANGAVTAVPADKAIEKARDRLRDVR